MNKLIFSLLLFPLLSSAQKPNFTFENDTVYTTCGYKIFTGQKLQFAVGLQRYNYFRYVTIVNGYVSATLANHTVTVKEITKFKTSVFGNGYVELKGYIQLKDGSTEIIVLNIAFDSAIENSPDLPSEMIVPDGFRNTRPRNIKKELVYAKNLYEDKVIKKPEYLELKKKLETQQTDKVQ